MKILFSSALALFSLSSLLCAQQNHWIEYEKVMRAPGALYTPGPGGFGEEINLYTGKASFRVTDIDIPGNGSTPVRLSRRLVVENRFGHGPREGAFGDWDLDIPRIEAVVSASQGWVVSGSTITSRCSSFGAPPTVNTITSAEYWHGYDLIMPGADPVPLLSRTTNNGASSDPVVASGWGTLSCMAITQSQTGIPNSGGQGFSMETPDGLTYEFTYMRSEPYASISRPAGKLIQTDGTVSNEIGGESGKEPDYTSLPQVTTDRIKVILSVKRITDQFGNSTTFTYGNNGDLNQISSSDGRTIQLFYGAGGGKISSISAEGRTWSYSYSGDSLSTVNVPGLGSWNYSLSNISSFSYTFPTTNVSCTSNGQIAAPSPMGSITSPTGLTATYTFNYLRHGRSGVVVSCFNSNGNFAQANPSTWDTLSMTSKSLSGGVSGTWGISYSTCTVLSCSSTKVVTVNGPVKDYTFNFGNVATTPTVYGDEGLLQSINGSEPRNFGYASAIGSYGPFGLNPLRVGTGTQLTARGTGARQETLRPLNSISYVGTGHSVNFGSFDQFGYPQLITENGSQTITTNLNYRQYNGSFRLFGLVETRTMNGVVVEANTYSSGGRKLTARSFGRLVATMTYDGVGLMTSLTDGRNLATTYSDYFRGKPRLVSHPGTTNTAYTVSDYGQITGERSEAGIWTYYDRDEADRITAIRSTGRSTRTFGYSATGTTVTETYGSLTRTIGRDTLWRPTSVNENNTRYSKKIYDIEGRVTYASYPSSTSTAASGVDYSYDTWDRPTFIGRDSELGSLNTTITYSGSNATVSDRGRTTSYSFLSYGFPTYKWPTSISEERTTSIDRDIWGNPESITRGSISRTFAYDSSRRLCGIFSPETGGTSMLLDGNGNVIGYTEGTSSLGCNGNAITQTFDDRNRLITTNYPGTVHDITRDYTADGLLASIENANSEWNYGYTNDGRRALTSETLTRRGALATNGVASTRAFTYSVTAQGYRSGMTYPSGLSLSYSPNAWGQPTQAGTYATNVTYRANGALGGFTYGNGAVRQYGYNTRWLPTTISDTLTGTSIMNVSFGYDEFANPTQMNDIAPGGFGNRSLQYDRYDRLTNAQGTSAWGGPVTFGYDNTDNITQEIRGSSTRSYTYNSSNNRLTSISNTPISSVQYDSRGNTTQWGTQILSYAPTNRLEISTEPGNYYTQQDDRFYYDGAGNRLRSHSTLGAPSTPGGSLPRTPYIIDQIYASGELMQTESQAAQTVCVSPTGVTSVSNDDVLTNHIYLAGSRIASVSKRIGSGTFDCGTRYTHSDQTSTANAFSNHLGTIDRVSRRPYEQVGNHITGLPGNLTYMEARYYDRNYGRMLSPDPVFVSAFVGSNFNRYAYANNNPYRYMDPDGRQSVPSVGLPFFEWLATPAETRPTNRTMIENQLAVELSQPRSGAEVAELVLIAVSAGTGGGARGLGVRVGVPASANFAQIGFRESFSKRGKLELSKIVGQQINTIDDLAGALNSNLVTPSQIPVIIITRGENTLILNTRSSKALERAGIPRSQWRPVDKSGDSFFEESLDNQLERNKLGPEGTPVSNPE